jgi:hypothetical protein
MYDEIKDITRRLGWWFLKPGEFVMACEKCQGLKKGEHIVRIHPIRIKSTRPEPLRVITPDDVRREGFPLMTPTEFVEMFLRHMKGTPDTIVNRIEFQHMSEYLCLGCQEIFVASAGHIDPCPKCGDDMSVWIDPAYDPYEDVAPEAAR